MPYLHEWFEIAGIVPAALAAGGSPFFLSAAILVYIDWKNRSQLDGARRKAI